MYQEPKVCTACREDTPEKYFGCEYPCHIYRRWVLERAGTAVSSRSAQAVRRLIAERTERESHKPPFESVGGD